MTWLLLRQAYTRTMDLLTSHKEDVDKVAKLLLDKEVLARDDMVATVGPRPYEEKSMFSLCLLVLCMFLLCGIRRS